MALPTMRYHLILVGAAVWHMAQSMTEILVPLYAHSLGFSAFSIGSLVSLPMVAQLVTRFVAGALSDRWGEKLLLLFCFSAMAVAGPIYLVADTFVLLVGAQLAAVLSRSAYYICSQSYVTRMPGADSAGMRLGYLNAANNGGAILGLVVAGLLLASFGFGPSFVVFTAVALVALTSGLLLPPLPRMSSRRSVTEIVGKMLALAKKRPMALTVVCSFGAALPISLGQFYVLFIIHLGYGEEITGLVAAVRSGGSILMGVLIARFITLRTHRLFFKLGFLGLGASLLLMPVSGQAAVIALLVGLTGLTSGILDMLYQTLASLVSAEANRASAFAVGGLGFSLCHVVAPVSFGLLVDTSGYTLAFYCFAVILIGAAALTPAVYRWLMTEHELQEGRSAAEVT